jgi:hypothetical protein
MVSQGALSLPGGSGTSSAAPGTNGPTTDDAPVVVSAGVTSGSTSSSSSDGTSITSTTSSPSSSSGNTAANGAAVAAGGSSTTSGATRAQPDAVGGEGPVGDGGGASGSHLTEGQVAGLMSMGYTDEQIMTADAMSVEGASDDEIWFRLGRPAPAAAPSKPLKLKDPLEDMPGVTQAADVLGAIWQYLAISTKDAALGEASEERTNLGSGAQVAIGLTGLDTAQDLRDVSVSGYKLTQDPNDPAKWKTFAIYAGFALIPFVAGAAFARAGREADDVVEGAKGVVESVAPKGGFPNQYPNQLAGELADAASVGAKPIRFGDPGFNKAVNSGTIKYVVTESGEVLITPHTVKGVEISHAVLSNGQNVVAAGEAEIAVAGGKYVGIDLNYQSGHFLPTAESLQAAREAFAKLGITFP